MPEALWQFFLKDRRVLMVAGTHGKTTSTAMMAHVLEAAGRDPSMLVGGVASDFGSNYRLGRGDDFVTEVIQCLAENRIRVTDFRTVLPNLEDVFLKLTGHSIRD